MITAAEVIIRQRKLEQEFLENQKLFKKKIAERFEEIFAEEFPNLQNLIGDFLVDVENEINKLELFYYQSVTVNFKIPKEAESKLEFIEIPGRKLEGVVYNANSVAEKFYCEIEKELLKYGFKAELYSPYSRATNSFNVVVSWDQSNPK